MKKKWDFLPLKLIDSDRGFFQGDLLLLTKVWSICIYIRLRAVKESDIKKLPSADI